MGALLFFPLVVMRRSVGIEGASPLLIETAIDSLRPLLQGFAFSAVLIAVNGISSTDRKQGYYRFAFAKPVSITRFYAQSFAVNWAGLVLATTVVMTAFQIFVYPVPIGGALGFVALYYLALGGIGFLLSAITRFDWVIASGIWGVTLMLGLLFSPDSAFGRVIGVALPPAQRMMDLAEPMLRGHPVPLTSLLWVSGYGALCFLIGLFVLRQRQLAA
ncbi:MAG: hypothetical protein ABR543_02875 [Gemmatimonadaceae bacterium]